MMLLKKFDLEPIFFTLEAPERADASGLVKCLSKSFVPMEIISDKLSTLKEGPYW